MAIMDVFFRLWQILTLNVQSVSNELDEEMREHMEQRVEMLNWEMTRVWQEVEERSQEQRNQQERSQEHSGFAWASRLLSALQHWQFWAVAGVLVLLFGLCWWLRKRSREPEREEESSGNNVEEKEHQEQNDSANDPGRFFEDPIERRFQNRDRAREAVKNLVEKLIDLFNYDFNAWYPVLEKAIEVGSAFEGWSPCEEDITYHLLVPLKPPRGHIFYLEPRPMWPMRNFRIRVDLVCTCEMEQPAGETRCLLHDPEEEQSRKEGPSILQDLCTGSYLDVQKTAEWLQKMVRHFWKKMPESATYRLMPLPSERSCKFRILRGWEKRFLIELMPAVQEGDSDVFLSTQYIEAPFTPRTLWPESYAVAETKLFRHIARQAQPDSAHLRCLQLCARSAPGKDFCIYALKTVVMHLLTSMPLSDWCKRSSFEQLEDIMRYLNRCLSNKCLNHFFIGNEDVPEDINLPLNARMTGPLNLFHYLEQSRDAHKEAKLEFEHLRRQVGGFLLYGH